MAFTPVGWYGKIPSLGDFATRRLPTTFVQPWDGWLQRVISASRERLGPRWLELYLSAAPWQFAIPAGLLDSNGWIGVLVPSVDRVGRHFPVTIAAPLGRDDDPLLALAAAEEWLMSAENAAVDALSPRMTVEQFEQLLAGLGLPPAPPRLDLSDETVPLPKAQRQRILIELDEPLRSAEMMRLLREGFGVLRQPYCLWYCPALDSEPARVGGTEGLPDGDAFCAMLGARWAEHGWQVAQTGEAEPVVEESIDELLAALQLPPIPKTGAATLVKEDPEATQTLPVFKFTPPAAEPAASQTAGTESTAAGNPGNFPAPAGDAKAPGDANAEHAQPQGNPPAGPETAPIGAAATAAVPVAKAEDPEATQTLPAFKFDTPVPAAPSAQPRPPGTPAKVAGVADAEDTLPLPTETHTP